MVMVTQSLRLRTNIGSWVFFMRFEAVMRLYRLDAWSKWGCMAVAAVALCWIMGCSEGSSASVSGQVSYKGEAVESGAIRFLPSGDTPPPGGSAKIANGSFSIPATDGMFAGSYKVTISAVRDATKAEAAEMAEGEDAGMDAETLGVDEEEEGGGGSSGVIGPQVQFLPDEYNLATKLTAEISPGENTKNFELE